MEKMTGKELQDRIVYLRRCYDGMKAQGLNLDMSRGKPGMDQLNMTASLLDCVNSGSDFLTADGVDVRNYGLMDGIPEAKALFAGLLGVEPAQVVVGGNSSLNMMFDFITLAFTHGLNGAEPWARQGRTKFLCPVPGYDRHFSVTEFYDIQMLPVAMTSEGPRMDEVEELVKDPLVKGIWCVPIYSNPDGFTYSDETVRRLAAMKCAAPDFRIMWDAAYGVHHLYDTPDTLLNLYEEARKQGNEDRVVIFVSTSKMTYPGAGVAAMAGSPATVDQVKRRMSAQNIGHDKINMLRHVRFFQKEGIPAHMKRHAAILRLKFETVLDTLEQNLGGKGIAEWNKPRGGYFINVRLLDGCAAETIRLLKEAGVVMTPAGASWPYGKDPRDSNVRIAPTYPPKNELETAMRLFCVAAELVCAQKLLPQAQ
jgi:DNA-binding transcriptional MocR family regulator